MTGAIEAVMESIKTIQETIDEHKEALPTGLVTTVMEECQKLYDALPPNLYRVRYVTVQAFEDTVDTDEGSLIVEECEAGPMAPGNWYGVFRHARMPRGFDCSDKVVSMSVNYVKVVTGFEPYKKREREE